MIDKKQVGNLNFSNSVDGLMFPNINVFHFNNSNFLHRMSDYLETKHHKTLKNLMKNDRKNLVVAFTHMGEWKDSKVTYKMKNLIKMIKIKYQNTQELNNTLSPFQESFSQKLSSFGRINRKKLNKNKNLESKINRKK